MATRRESLVTTLAAAALPPALMANPRDARPSLQVISETLCPDGNAFSQSCGGAAEALEHDPAALLFALEAALSAGTIGAVVGLTRPSTRFLIEQCAARYGCFPSYHAHHRYSSDTLVHELHAAPAVNMRIKRRLLHKPRYWARTLADSFDVMATTGGLQETLTLRVPVSDDGQSRHLVSWMLQRFPA